jgi:hypothetical protein
MPIHCRGLISINASDDNNVYLKILQVLDITKKEYEYYKKSSHEWGKMKEKSYNSRNNTSYYWH